MANTTLTPAQQKQAEKAQASNAPLGDAEKLELIQQEADKKKAREADKPVGNEDKNTVVTNDPEDFGNNDNNRRVWERMKKQGESSASLTTFVPDEKPVNESANTVQISTETLGLAPSVWQRNT